MSTKIPNTIRDAARPDTRTWRLVLGILVDIESPGVNTLSGLSKYEVYLTNKK